MKPILHLIPAGHSCVSIWPSEFTLSPRAAVTRRRLRLKTETRGCKIFAGSIERVGGVVGGRTPLYSVTPVLRLQVLYSFGLFVVTRDR